MSKNKKRSPSSSGRFAYEGLERIIHEKARLGILTSLMTQPDGLQFSELKELCDLTDGNLNRHLDVLSQAGLVTVAKDQSSRRDSGRGAGRGAGRALTFCRLTTTGRERFLEYLQELERVIADAAQASADIAPRALRVSTN